MSLVFVGGGFLAMMCVSVLAIDLGMVMTARNQAQNSADAGALAGAIALGFEDYSNRTASGPAVQNALNAALANQVMGSNVSITSGDVTFPNDAAGQPNLVRVTVYRDGSRSNPLTNLIAGYFGSPNTNISATATAETRQANAVTCVKPWAVPDKWTERQTPGWDVNDTFNAFPTNPSVLPDIFRDASLGTYTGYNSITDRGLQLSLTVVTTNTIKPNMYFTLALPGDSGAADYRENISTCDTNTMHFGDNLSIEGGATVSDTTTEAAALIAQDPGATWDAVNKRVISTMNPSPRIVVLPLYDPMYFNQGKQSGIFTQLRVSNYIGFFIESVSGSNVVGRITPVSGSIDTSVAAAPTGGFPRATRLIE
jgi:Flp pilus assembly protein TadG